MGQGRKGRYITNTTVLTAVKLKPYHSKISCTCTLEKKAIQLSLKKTNVHIIIHVIVTKNPFNEKV